MSNNSPGNWYFYHKQEKAKFGPLTLQSLCSFLITNNIGLEDVFLCKKGWPKWKMGLETEEFIVEYKIQFEINNELPPMLDDPSEDAMPPAIPTIINKAPEIPKEKLNLRKHPRHEIELKVIFVADKKTFRTKTKDLSLGGIQITDAVPESFFNKNIQVFISSQDLKISIKFEAILLPNRSSTKFIQFVSQTEGSLKFLESWLNSVSDSSGQILKKSA